MTERPIIFSAPMVRALLAGTKTQTRRIIKDQTIGYRFSEMRPDGAYLEWTGTPCCGTGVWDVPEYSGIAKVPYGQPGDRLWVRETFGHFERNDTLKPGDTIYYRADGQCLEIEPWRPSIHMPRWASRITLEVTGVRVERLQEISEADASAEGAAGHPDGPWHAYRSLWSLINGPGSWDANPYCWVVEFKRLEG